jgi:hypothetical protein
LSVAGRLSGNRKGTGGVRGWGINTHYCMGFQETNGRSKFIVCVRVHTHDSDAVAGVIRVQKMDLVVGRIAGNDLCHGSCCHCRDMMQSVKLEGGVDSTRVLLVLYFQEPFEVRTNAHTPRLTPHTGDQGEERKDA